MPAERPAVGPWARDAPPGAVRQSHQLAKTLTMDQSRTASTQPAGNAALNRLSDSRWRLLREVLRHRASGRTVDELAGALEVSHNAVQQHVTALERDGLLCVLELRSTGGRPGRAYTLTEAGLEVFPRSYAQMADGLLRHVRRAFGEVGLNRLLDDMASEMAADLAPRLEGKGGKERAETVARMLDELGYDARLDEAGRITAVNCVYHELARNSRAVCRFDTRLVRLLLGYDVAHQRCMADGHASCVFATEPRAGSSRGTSPTPSPTPADVS